MNRRLVQLFLGAAGLLGAYAWWGEPSRLHLTRYEVSNPDRPLDGPVRALLLTDWHLGRWSSPRRLRAKMERLRRLHQREPFDVVLLGGDYVDTEARYLPRLVPALETLRRFGVPVLAVLGNHDYASFGGDAAAVVACLEAHGAQVLCGEVQVITAGRQRVLVVGLDDLQESANYYQQDIYKVPEQYRQAAERMDWYARLDSHEPDVPRILLAHNPDAVFLPGRTPLAVLAGHTHGGQIMLLDWLSRPLHRWIHPHLPPGSAVTWAGRRRVNGRTLIVSRGIEGSALPLRLLRPPEAVVVTFR